MSVHLNDNVIELFGSHFVKQCVDGNIDEVQKCIDNNVLSYLDFGKSAFMEAFNNKHYNIMDLLLSSGVNINITYVRQIMDCITDDPDLSMLNLLIKYDLIFINHGECEYLQACLHGDKLCLSYIFTYHNVDVAVCDNLGRTGLMHACQNGHLGVVSIMLKHMMDRTDPHIIKKIIQTIDHNGDNIITITCANGHTEILNLLMNANLPGLDIHHVNDNGENGITLACCNGHYDIVQILFNHGASINNVIDNGYANTLKLLLDIGF